MLDNYRFQRNYRAEFEIGSIGKGNKYIFEENIEIKYPITCNLLIDLGIYGSANKGFFQFFNLAKQTQAKLWLDNYEIGKKYVKLKFYAGYGNVMPLVFQGFMQQCLSYRESGSTEFITEMQGFEGGELFSYGYVNSTFTKGTEAKDVLNAILDGYPDIKLGYISPEIPKLPRNKTFIGQTMDLLGAEYGGYDIFIEKGELNILGKDEVVPGDIQVISAKSGLLGSPKRSNLFTEIETIFEPRFRSAQAILLESSVDSRFTQLYEIVGIKHKGIISPSSCGKLITECTLSLLQTPPKKLTKTVPTTYNGKASSGIWIKPVKGQRISGEFHEVRETHLHKGIDIAADLNEPVYAPANGIITRAEWFDGYGKYVQINHGKNEEGQVVSSAYGHLNNWIVNIGQTVTQGEQIGIVGSTGNSSGPHLHFEVLVDGVEVNPTYYIGNYG